MTLSLAPLQGFTDAPFRQVWQQHFEGLDAFFAPYIALQNDASIKNSQWRDILPERNKELPIPQILPNSANEALSLMARIDGLGVYSEVNINMGCPYPMVTRKGRGAGLLTEPHVIRDILSSLFEHYGTRYRFSVKCRCGLNDFSEMETFFKVLNDFQLSSIILHPRIAKQLYKGQASTSHFAQAINMTTHPLVYNGDISSLEDYHTLMQLFPHQKAFMLGRGVLKNPLLPQEIKRGEAYSSLERLDLIAPFVSDLMALNATNLSGESHLLSKMKSYLPYFEYYHLEERKLFKKMKKATGLKAFSQYLDAFLVH